MEKYCYNYIKEDIEYYAYIGSEFLSFDSAENLITNYNGFISTSGWYGINDGTVSSSVSLGDDLSTSSLTLDFNTAKKEVTFTKKKRLFNLLDYCCLFRTYAIFNKLEDRPLSKIAADFFKELKDDTIRFISKASK